MALKGLVWKGLDECTQNVYATESTHKDEQGWVAKRIWFPHLSNAQEQLKAVTRFAKALHAFHEGVRH
eukprot:scaffold105891_cov37-Tisochrysis_lutea.AAC.3